MTDARDQLQRVLQLALHSPYEGERAKAVALLLHRLQKEGLQLRDLDASFQDPDAENALRQRAGLAYTFEVTLKSREEALLFYGLMQRLDATSAQWIEGHRLRCTAPPAAKIAVEAQFHRHTASLHQRLAAAQQQAMDEYKRRRSELFAEAVSGELQSCRDDVGT